MLHALVVLSFTAHAYAPSPLQGSEPVRHRTTTAEGQAVWRQTAPWKAFTAGEGQGWQARADERTGMPQRMWGHLPLVSAGASEAELIEALRDFTARNGELLGSDGTLPLSAAGHDADRDLWYVDFQAQRDGLPIWRSALTFRVKHGNLIQAGADTYPDTPTRGDFTLSRQEAIRSAIAGGLAPEAEHTDLAVEPLWLPRNEDGLLVLRAVLEVRSRTETPRGDWVSFVDAASGEVLATYNEVRFLTGTVSATIDDRYPGNGTQTVPVKGAVVTTGTTSTTTDAFGGYTIANATTYQSHFLSSPIYLSDQTGDIGLNFDDFTPNPTWNSANGSIAAIDTFVWLNEVRDVFHDVVPSESFTTGNLSGTVNLNDVCNAYWDGTVNFYQSGGGCANTGRLADVVYHEWGHGFHQYRIITGSFDGALSEGAGDTTSFLLTGDSALAPGFFLSGGALRNADNTNTYPTDLSGEVHEDGLIYVGAMWDTWLNLSTALGPATATDVLSDVFAGMLQGGPDLSTAIDEALAADDDDGNLANGTPHSCHIIPGFAAHGLGQLGSAPVSYAAGHLPEPWHPAVAPIPIQVEVVGPPGCATDFQAGTATVNYRVDGGSWSSAPLTTSGMDVTGSIPAQVPGAFVEYYVEIEGAGQTLASPTNGWRNPFSFYVGDLIEVHCDDFETSDGGFTHALLSGTAGQGADDWEHGAPNGQGGDPVSAHSGSYVWGNDLGTDGYNGLYQADKNNRLTGPVIELGHYTDPLLHYWRWLQVEDAAYDQATILANGLPVWTNVQGAGADHHADTQWAPHAVDLGSPGDQVQIAFDLSSDGGVELGGWTIDDVCIYVPSTPDNRLGITDFTASEGGERTVTLSWTNPVHAPLAEVRVVRGLNGACPAGPTDGEIVYYDGSPALGAPVTAEDAVPTTDTYCYAVYGGDGSAWLSWSVEGWNVDHGSASVPATEEEIEEQQEENGVDEVPTEDPAAGPGETPTAGNVGYGEIRGCSSAGSSGPGGLGLLGLLGLLAVFGRRRR